MNFSYNWRIAPEIGWFVAIALLTPILQAALDFTGVAQLTPDFWDGLLAACIRAGAGALIAVFTGGFQKPGEPGPLTGPSDGPQG